MPRPDLVCIIGTDGSGKTTLAKKVLSELQESGQKCKYVWLRSPHYISLAFMAACRILGLTKVHNFPNKLPCIEHQYYKNKPVALVWPWIQLVDLITFISIRVYLSNLFGSIVVCDRCVHDVLVDVMADINDNRLHRKLLGKLMLQLMPKSAPVFFLDVNEVIAFKRKHDVPNIAYLATRRKLYHLIAANSRISTINCERGFNEVYKIINQLLESEYDFRL